MHLRILIKCLDGQTAKLHAWAHDGYLNLPALIHHRAANGLTKQVAYKIYKEGSITQAMDGKKLRSVCTLAFRPDW